MSADEEQMVVAAYPRWEWDCLCGAINTTELPPPADEKCYACGLTVRTDPR